MDKMNADADLYAELGVSTEATAEEMKKVYRKVRSAVFATNQRTKCRSPSPQSAGVDVAIN